MKSWRPNWSDTESPEPERQSHSDDEDIEQSPKRRRTSPTGLTSEIQGFEIKQAKEMDKPNNLVLKETVAKNDKSVANGGDLTVPKPPVAKGTRISGVFSINDSLNESLMDGSFSEQDIIHQDVGYTEGHCEDVSKGHNEDISSIPGSHYDSCSENSITGDNHGKSIVTPPSVFYSCNSEASTVPTVNSLRGPHASSTREIHANSAHGTQASPENSHVTISSSSFVTPARSSRGAQSTGQSTSEQNEQKVFQTPVGNAPKHFQTASVTRIKFQSPMEIAYDVPPRSSNTTPRRRQNHVSM